MGMISSLVNAWNRITGKIALNEIANTGSRIADWLTIYSGNPKWLAYSYVGLDSQVHERKRLSLGAGKLVSSEIAGIIWAEQPVIKGSNGFVKFLEGNKFFRRARVYTELGAALGGWGMKLYSADGRALKLDFFSADDFVPVSWDSTQITEADFLDRRVVGGATLLKVEHHRKIDGGYEISFEVFEEQVGGKYAKTNPERLGLSAEPTTIATDVPLFVYIPYPDANNIDIHSPLGISIFANATDTLQAIDIAFDAMQHEIVMGKRRITVPASAVRTVIGENGNRETYFDPADEVFVAFNDDEKSSMAIQDNTVELRIEQVRAALQALLDVLAIQVGFSAGTIALAGAGISMKTATEVVSENSKTFKTKQSYENSIEEGLIALFAAIQEIGPLYGDALDGGDVSVEWSDSVVDDRATVEKRWIERYNAKTCLLSDVLEKLDGLTPAQAKKKAKEIQSESATVDVSDFVGDDGPGAFGGRGNPEAPEKPEDAGQPEKAVV